MGGWYAPDSGRSSSSSPSESASLRRFPVAGAADIRGLEEGAAGVAGGKRGETREGFLTRRAGRNPRDGLCVCVGGSGFISSE